MESTRKYSRPPTVNSMKSDSSGKVYSLPTASSYVVKSPTNALTEPKKSHAMTLQDFVQSKRDNFHFNLSMTNKKNEISRLEKEAEEKKKRLLEVETLLESDAVKFEKFLKDNDDAAHAALKR